MSERPTEKVHTQQRSKTMQNAITEGNLNNIYATRYLMPGEPVITTSDGMVWTANSIEGMHNVLRRTTERCAAVQLELDRLRGQIHVLDLAQRP